MKVDTMLVCERFCCRRYSTYVFGRYPCTLCTRYPKMLECRNITVDTICLLSH